MEIIKIGGSLIFGKNGDLLFHKLRPLIEIILAHNTDSIIVIGCGNKMHDMTTSNNLTDKPIRDMYGEILFEGKRLCGFCEIFVAIEKRIDTIYSAFSIKTINPIKLIVKASMDNELSHEIDYFNKELLTKLPVLTSGGLVFDRNLLVSAISSDTIAAFLAHEFNTKRVKFLTNVDGLYSNRAEEVLIREINILDTKRLSLVGGMGNKIRRIANGLKGKQIEILILNGLYPDRLRDLLIGRDNGLYTKVIM